MHNKTYYFRWKYKYFWHKLKVMGHKYEEDQNKMVLFIPDGGIREIARWSSCECSLGVDWALATKEQIKEEAGQ